MLANFDYPASAEFCASLVAELEHLLDRTQLNPSLAVLCGGSEVLQQAVMFGLSQDQIDDSLYCSVIPEVVQSKRPDLVYIANSPSGGDLPFHTNAGVTHYYGVGAYLRPLMDARAANVRFASECLALANVPCELTVREMQIASITEPLWKASVPRDPGAGWDFDDVRDHYLASLFRVDPLHLRYTDLDRYLDLSRAVSCILIEHTINEWRRTGSTCHGGLVWQWQDVTRGAGWGMLDALGRRKSAWYALQRASRVRHVILTDEGLNGLVVHIVNEADSPLRATLRIACFRQDHPIRTEERMVALGPRSVAALSFAALVPGFFDVTYAYRFGPRVHEVTMAELHDATTGELIADAYHFPDIAALQPHELGLEATVKHGAKGWELYLQSRHFAQFLHVDDDSFIPSENWLHLPPGRVRRIALRPCGDPGAIPQGEVRALNMDRVLRYVGQR
jgi:beta-mannosidase